MEKDPSPLDTLRQLKEWLDAGTITPEEFQTLKQKLVFTDASARPPAAPQTPAVPPAVEETPPPAAPPLPPNMAAPVAVVPPALPAAPPEPTIIAPLDDPLLPPLTHQPAAGRPAEAVPPAPPVSGPGFSHPLEAGRPAASPGRADEFLTPAAAPAPAEEYVEDEAYAVPAKSPLGTLLVVGGIVALLALVAYLMMGNQDSERLTSTTLTAADSVATRPDEGPQTEQIELPPVAAPETIRVEQPATPLPAPAADTAAAPEPAADPAPVTEPAAADAGAEARITGVLQRYYADLQAAPFTASAYFAPQVERFYLQQNTTPAAINAELEKTHFPEFLEGQTTIRPGSLQVSPPVADGSRVVTYVENSTALRQSLQKRQQTAAQVRVRFDKNFKIVYLRQEKLLENNFTD
ncbi:SHOCT domain-containing protein [Hymenobacter sp. NST-14]|uniref:SHOCT domain-containing protein n=1 Tax=Hymenobacter piscis TaxID=2839984 RepID=UPI001C032733|nr:SHOCT domain-containing protein [Hymenobacter piscis]MBT9391922.1 SHOCT domain-containing protein [Hymenobacter piscis]